MNSTSSSQFDPVYWASFPLAVQALATMTDPDARKKAAVSLARQGFIIDSDIHALGGDPFGEMILRASFGYTWWPNVLQPNIPVAPGLPSPGVGYPAYDPDHPPAGSIKVSVDPADYPPFVKPTPAPAPPNNTSLVSVYIGLDNDGDILYAANVPLVLASTLKNGDGYVETAGSYLGQPSRGKFILHEHGSPFGGIDMYFTLVLVATT